MHPEDAARARKLLIRHKMTVVTIMKMAAAAQHCYYYYLFFSLHPSSSSSSPELFSVARARALPPLRSRINDGKTSHHQREKVIYAGLCARLFFRERVESPLVVVLAFAREMR